MLKPKFQVGDEVIYVPMGHYEDEPSEVPAVVVATLKHGHYTVLLAGACLPQVVSASSLFDPAAPRPKSKIVPRSADEMQDLIVAWRR